MSRVRFLAALLVAAAVSATSEGVAQIAEGRIVGTVTDAQGAALKAVRVSATSSDGAAAHVTFSGADGGYAFSSLPPGPYKLAFERSGFRSETRDHLELTAGVTVTASATLEIAALRETVAVTPDPSLVGTASTKLVTRLPAEKLAAVPSATDMWSVLGQSEGIRMTGYDVGGGHKSQSTGSEAYGIRDNRVLVEGVVTGNWYVDYFANEEVAVTGAGGDVEAGTPGASIAITVKSGGNTFHGLETFAYEGPRWVGNNIDEQTAALGFTGQPNLLFWEGHTDLGGPLKRDRLTFYHAYNHFHIDKALSGVPQSLATDVGIFDAAAMKYTYRPSARDMLIGAILLQRKQKPLRGLSALVPPESILAQDSPYWTYKAEHQRSWSNRLFTDMRFGFWGFDWPLTPAVSPTTHPPRLDTATRRQSGAGWDAFTNRPASPEVFGSVAYSALDAVGTHDVKAGFEWQRVVHHDTVNGNSGPIEYLDSGGKPDQIQMVDVGRPGDLGRTWDGAEDRDRLSAVYAQDRWSPMTRLTATLGLRYEIQNPSYGDGRRDPVLKEIFPAGSIPGRSLVSRANLGPRLGVSYDVTGTGTTLVKAYYGRFFVFLDKALSTANPGGANYKTFKFFDVSGTGLYDRIQDITDPQTGALALLSARGGVATAVDPHFRIPSTHEFSGAVEHQFRGESSARIGYVRKLSRDNWGIVNVAREGQFTIPFTTPPVDLVNYSATNPAGQVIDQQSFALVTIPAPLAGIVHNLITNVPGGDWTYDTITVAGQSRVGARLFLQSGLDYEWRNEQRGGVTMTASTVTASTSPLDSDPLGIGYVQNVRPLVPNRQRSTTWQLHALGRCEVTHQVGVAVNLRVQSGWPYARVVQVPVPGLGSQAFLFDNIDEHRSDTVPILDVRVDKSFRLRRSTFSAMLDVFNVTNSNAVTNFILTNGASFGQIISALDPRTAQVGLRLAF
jgi:hypothetical protein